MGGASKASINNAGTVFAGAVGAMAYSFNGATTCAWYASAADTLRLRTNGIDRWLFNTNSMLGLQATSQIGASSGGQLQIGGRLNTSVGDLGPTVLIDNQGSVLGGASGTATHTKLFFDASTQTGTGGWKALVVDVTDSASTGIKRLLDLGVGGVSKTYIDNGGRHYLPDGALATPALAFASDADSGIANAVLLGATAGVVFVGNGILAGAAAVNGTIGQLLAPLGTVGAAGLAVDNWDSGLYAPGAKVVGATAAGVEVFRWQAPSGVKPQLLLAAGLATDPALAMTGDPNTGLYSVGADQLGVATGGTLRLTVGTASVTSALPFLGPDGAVAAPSHSFSAQTDIGMYRPAADTIGFATGSALRLSVDKAVVATTLPVEYSSTTMGTPAADTVRVGVPNTSAGRPRFLALKDPYFGETFVATAYHDRQKFFLLPSGAATMVNAGFQMSTSGTVAYVAPASTSFLAACQKNSFVTAGANTVAEIHGTTPIVAQGDATTKLGFMFHARFAVGADYTANTRLFVGLINSAAALGGTANPNTLINSRLIGVALNSGSAALVVLHCDGAGVMGSTSTGLTVSANDAFDVWIWMPPNSTTRYVYVNRINGAVGTYSGSAFTLPPGANQWLYPHSWIATADTAKTLYVMRWAIESGQ